MARKNKPVKIKRYKNSMGTNTRTVAAAKRLLAIAGAGLVLVGAGFLLGKPVINFLSGAGREKPQPTMSPQVTQQPPVITPLPDIDTQPTHIPQEIPPVVQSKNRTYLFVTPLAVSSPDDIDNVIRQMKDKGATHLVLDVKNKDGNLHYKSRNQYGRQLAADTVVDLQLLSDKLKENGLTPVARIYTFMDKMISTVERSTAVMYRGSDTRWLDTSATLGGKAWANPASAVMQEYIISITDEIMSKGITEIIFAGFSTPTGYSLDKRDFGATMDQVLANMKKLIGILQAKVSAKGGYSSWQFEYSAVTEDGTYAQYIVHPYQLGAENIILTAKGGDIQVQQAVDSILPKQNNGDMGNITLWLTDGADTELTHKLGDYFIN